MRVALLLPGSDDALMEGIQDLMDTYAAVWARWIRRNPGALPPLRESGIVWRPEPWPGWEEWAPPPIVYGRGWGDCDDVVLWRLAELLASGESEAYSQVLRDTQDPTRYHISVRRASDVEEDPSQWFPEGK